MLIGDIVVSFSEEPFHVLMCIALNCISLILLISLASSFDVDDVLFTFSLLLFLSLN